MITLLELEKIICSRKSMTASELDELLQSCPEWVAEDAAREAKRADAEARFALEEAPIITELAELGFSVRSVWDFVNTNQDYTAAIPTLLTHFALPYHTRIHEGIIRALTTKEARGLAETALLEALLVETDENIRWVLANALTVVASKSQTVAIEKLLDTRAFGDVHERLGAALRRLKRGKS